MFTNVLGTLTSLLPKNFIFGSYVPVLIFGFVNAALLYAHDAGFRSWAHGEIEHPLSLTLAVAFVASIVAAYVLSTINDFLRELLEGKFLPPYIAKNLRYSEWQRLDALNLSYIKKRDQGRALREELPKWNERLDNAANAAPLGVTGYDRKTSDVTAALAELRAHRDNLKVKHVETAVASMETALRTWDVDQDHALDDDRSALGSLIGDAINMLAGRELQLFTERQVSFGLRAPEPTRMGNVAGALQSYANDLYQLDLDTFWSRLQAVIQDGDKTGYDALVAAKTQLDFLVACCWLDLGTTAVWFFSLAAWGSSLLVFALVALIGPTLFVAFYRLAVTNYLSYGELVRAIVDLNRFALLKRLHIALPIGIRDERRVWSALRRVASFGEDDVELSYEHPPS